MSDRFVWAMAIFTFGLPMAASAEALTPEVSPVNEPHAPCSALATSQYETAINRNLLRFSFEGGRLHVNQGLGELSLGFFGQRAPEILAQSPQARQEALQYHHARIGSVVTGWLGSVSLLADLIFTIVRVNQSNHAFEGGKDQAVFWSLLGGGLGLDIASASLRNKANFHLGRAVGLANEEMVHKTLGVGLQTSLEQNRPNPKSLVASVQLSF